VEIVSPVRRQHMVIMVALVETQHSARWPRPMAAAVVVVGLGARRTVLVALVDHYDHLDQTLAQGRSAGLGEETARMAAEQQR